MSTIARVAAPILRRTFHSLDRLFGFRAYLAQDQPGVGITLDGDRAIEWSFVVSNLPRQPARILDVGCVQSALTCIAARLGHHVTGIDLRDIEYSMDGVTFIKSDIAAMSLPTQTFDLIINSSSIEHIGLEGRYGSRHDVDGDLLVMRSLADSLAPQGLMVLTIPVGQDQVCAPWHRIYGERRLPMLLETYSVAYAEYWTKEPDNRWRLCDADRALRVQGSERFYALGCFVVCRKGSIS